MTDSELYRVAARRMIDAGSQGPRFIFVGAGPTKFAANAPFPTGYRLEEGDFVRADMGATCLGYPADFVRSYFLSRCPAGTEAVWRALNNAQLDLAASIRPGQRAGAIYERGFASIGRHLGRFSREFIGHGIGLVLNEEPRLHAGSAVEIEADTVMCVEFSAYLADGARLHTEDMLHVTDNGAEIWTADCPRELVVQV